VLIDSSNTRGMAGAVVRKQIGDWAKQREEVVHQYALAAAFVMPSSLARGALTAILWVAPPKYPMDVFATQLDALPFLQKHFEDQEGLSDVFERYRRERTANAQSNLR
jgi:hypothetical protein